MTRVISIDSKILNINEFEDGMTIPLDETLKLKKVGSRYELTKDINNPNEIFMPIMEFQYKKDDKEREYYVLHYFTGITYMGGFKEIVSYLKNKYNIRIRRIEQEIDDVGIIKTANGNKAIRIRTKKHNIIIPIDDMLKIMIIGDEGFDLMYFDDYEINGGDDIGQPDKNKNNTD